MKVLIIYGTTEGQTRKICEFMAQQFAASDTVTLVDAAAKAAMPDVVNYDAAIVAASVHAHKYQAPVIEFARDNHDKLNAIPSMFVSVSLSAAGTDQKDLEGIKDCADQFLAETGWKRAEVQQVAGAFRFTKYDFFKGLAMRLIAMEKKVKAKRGEDIEFTDWDALGKVTTAFRARAAGGTRKAS